jgi:hypothetical protein
MRTYLTIITMAAALVVAGCSKGPEGPQGPQGVAGPQGAAGDVGGPVIANVTDNGASCEGPAGAALKARLVCAKK